MMLIGTGIAVGIGVSIIHIIAIGIKLIALLGVIIIIRIAWPKFILIIV